ncbi:class I SAM-dependent methyltransferase [Nibricoccus aquaticus]|nr:class I SAM-dependent methyltransferase [Nibricoccus aquaticus]
MSFDRLAPHYRWMEAVLAGRVLQQARTRWLDALRERRRVLIVGEGPGRTLEVMRRRWSRQRVTVVEASAGMIAAAQRRLARQGLSSEGIEWVHADVRSWLGERERTVEGGAEFDAVITPFVLDCFGAAELAGVVAGIAGQVSDGGCWLLTDFCLPPSGLRRLRGRLVHRLMYSFFRAAVKLEASRLTPPDEALVAAGFELEGRDLFNAGLVHSDLWRRMESARGLMRIKA